LGSLLHRFFWRIAYLILYWGTTLFNAFEEYHATLLALEKAGQDHPNYDQELYMRLKARKDAFLNKIATEIEKALQLAIQNFPYDEGYYGNLPIVFNNSRSLPWLDSTESWCFQGFESMRRDNKSHAFEAFKTAIDISPDNYLAYYGICMLYRSWNQMEEAINACKQAIQLNPEFVAGYHLLGHIHLALYEFDVATDFFEKSMELDPKFVPSILGLAKVWLLKEQPDKALSFLEAEHGRLPIDKSIDMLITFIKILVNDSSIEQKEDKFLELLLAYLPEVTDNIIRTAIFDLELALKDAKIIMASFLRDSIEDIYAIDLIDIFIMVAKLNIFETRFDKAISVLKKAVEFSPNLIEFYIILGHAYYLADSTSSAVDIYEQAVSLNPRNIYPYIGLAKTYLLNDKIDEAIRMSFKSLEIDAYSTESHIILAACYKRLGYEDKFAEQIDAVINQENLDNFNRARIEILCGNDEKGLSLIELSFNDGLIDLSDIQNDPCIIGIKGNPTLSGLIEKYRYDFVRLKT
jgi:tetratricopeptide (TPR) repeat protein